MVFKYRREVAGPAGPCNIPLPKDWAGLLGVCLMADPQSKVCPAVVVGHWGAAGSTGA